MDCQFSIYDILAEIRPRPVMYLGIYSILHLRSFLEGCSYIQWKYGITDQSIPDFDGFHDWCAKKFEWCGSTAGWDRIILKETNDDEAKALDRFFELLDEYKTIGTSS